MEASNSEAYSRVVNRRLYSKKVALSVVFAFVMVTSAFIVSTKSFAGVPIQEKLEAWTLLPVDPAWTEGNVKGYSEGDVVPVKLTLYKGNDDPATFIVKFQYGVGSDPDNPEIMGFEEEVLYTWPGDPAVPFNAPVSDPDPFRAFGSSPGFTITDEYMGREVSSNRIWDVWRLQIDWDTATQADVRVGGLLARTTVDYLGASYFPGASLEIRLQEGDQPGGGEETVSIMVLETLMPPYIELQKHMLPVVVYEGMTIDVSIIWSNTGQEDAWVLEIRDEIPVDASGDPLLAYHGPCYLTSTDGVWAGVEFDVPDTTDPDVIKWDLRTRDPPLIAEGTGLYFGSPQVFYTLSFKMDVIGYCRPVATNGIVKNWDYVVYTDTHNGIPEEPPEASAYCEFEVLRLGIDLTKDLIPPAVTLPIVAGEYILDDEGHTYVGDTVAYNINVENTGDVTLQYKVTDGLLGGEIMTGSLAKGASTGQQPFYYHVLGAGTENYVDPETGRTLLRNWANVEGWNAEKKVFDSDYADVDIVHPDLDIQKWFVPDFAVVGEEVEIHIKVANKGDCVLDFEIYDPLVLGGDPVWGPDSDGYEPLQPDDEIDGSGADEFKIVLRYTVDEDDVLDPDQEHALTYVHNEATVDAWFDENHPHLERTDSADLTVVDDTITILKEAVDEDGVELPDPGVGSDGKIRYKISITNDGTTPLWYFYYDDFDDMTDPDDAKLEPEIADDEPTVPGAPGPDSGMYFTYPGGIWCWNCLKLSDHEVAVLPGESFWICTLIDTVVESGHGSATAIYTSSWGVHSASYWSLGTVPVGTDRRHYDLDGTAPMDEGVYYLIVAMYWYVDEAYIASATAPFVGAPKWDDDNNIADFSVEQVLAAQLNGRTPVQVQTGVGTYETLIVPAEVITVYVQQPEYLVGSRLPVSPPELKQRFDHRLWLGYLMPGETEFMYYDYVVQEIVDPDTTEDDIDANGNVLDTVYAYAWHNLDRMAYYSTDDDSEVVEALGWIYGYVYHDKDLSGHMDGGEEGLYDVEENYWKVSLYWLEGYDGDDNPIWVPKGFVFTEHSDSSKLGYYRFDNLIPGTYYVEESLLEDDWFPTAHDHIDPDPDYKSHDLTVTAGDGTEHNMGNAKEGTISGFKWLDWNMDGNDDGTEPRINGWAIYLWGVDWMDVERGSEEEPYMTKTTTTDPDNGPGWYEFTVEPGTWTIKEDSPLDSEGKMRWVNTEPGTGEIIVGLDENGISTCNKFGNVYVRTVSGYKFYDGADKDMNGWPDDGFKDGDKDPNEVGLNDWTMTLDSDDADQNPDFTALTGAGKVDVLFAVDMSYSMYPWDAEKTALCGIVDNLVLAGLSVQFGLVTFVDYPGTYYTPDSGWGYYYAGYGYEYNDDYAYRLDVSLTDDAGDVKTAINGLYHYGGDDRPQDLSRVIYESYSDPEIHWRAGAERVLVLVGDSWAHDADFDYDDDEQKENWGGDPGRDEILNSPTTPSTDDLDFQTVVSEAHAAGVHIMAVLEPDWDAQPREWQFMAEETGGAYFLLADAENGVSDEIVAVASLGEPGYFEFPDLLPGVYSLGEVEPSGQEDYWYATTDPFPVEIDLNEQPETQTWPSPNEPHHHYINLVDIVITDVLQDVGNMRMGEVVGYKFIDEFGEDGTWPNSKLDSTENGVCLQWAISYNKKGDTDPPDCTYASIVSDTDRPWMIGSIQTANGLGWYEIKLDPGWYVVSEEWRTGWMPTTPCEATVVIPAYPYGDVARMRVDFGNCQPTMDPEVPFLLEAGWNLWSTPVTVDGLTAKGLLSIIGPTGLAVSMLDEATGNYYSYVAGWSDDYDFPIEEGEGYFIYASARTHFYVMGDVIGASETKLVYGWNLIGYNSLRAVKASALLGMIQGCHGLAITYLDARTGNYYSYVAGWSLEYDFYVVPGRAYFLWADGAGNLITS